MSDLHGTCDDRFAAVRDTFANNLTRPDETGASVAVSLEGELVVDLWGGHADAAGTRPWQQDTIVNVWSTTKTMQALTALMLVDRGEIDLHAPVADVWPEFAANGKERITLAHCLAHSAGLSGLDVPTTAEETTDWDLICSRLAAQAPWWEPGTASAYHAITQGYLVGEVIRRATGRSLGRVFREDIAGPLGADFHIGLPESEFHRVAELVPPPGIELPPGTPADSIAARTFGSPAVDAPFAHDPRWRAAEVPAANGHGNARSVARVHTATANDGRAFGQQILSAQGCRRIFDEQTNGLDAALGIPVRWGLGFGLTSELMPLGPNPHTCFWGGWGGSVVVIDQDAHLVVSYMMNNMHAGLVGDDRGLGIVAAAMGAL